MSMLSTPDRFTAEVSFRPGVTQLNEAIKPIQLELLMKLQQNGVSDVFRGVFPSLRVPHTFRTTQSESRQNPEWEITALPLDPKGILLHINRTEESFAGPLTGALQIRYSNKGFILVSGRKIEFEGFVGDSLGDLERPFRTALYKAKYNPQFSFLGRI